MFMFINYLQFCKSLMNWIKNSEQITILVDMWLTESTHTHTHTHIRINMYYT